jgi:mitogen-activated protein kinase kinase
MDASSLSRVLRRRRQVKGGFLESVLAEAAAHYVMGLAKLHSRGVAHMDVK